MSIFCLLWVPLFFLLRRTFTGGGASGGVWALLLGSITAILQFFLGYIISPGGFGFSRWLFGFVEIVSLPVLIPMILYALLCVFRGFSGDADFANFALLWLIPVAALRAIGWGATNDTILLVTIPLLWTALAVGISFFINWTANNFRWYTLIISFLCILILPVSAATSYWAFFSQHTALGFLLLFATHIPFGLSIAFDISNA
jgi:hypothetical protein